MLAGVTHITLACMLTRQVRGAYMELERARAAKLGHPSPIWPTIEETHTNYDSLAELLLREAGRNRAEVLLGTHNQVCKGGVQGGRGGGECVGAEGVSIRECNDCRWEGGHRCCWGHTNTCAAGKRESGLPAPGCQHHAKVLWPHDARRCKGPPEQPSSTVSQHPPRFRHQPLMGTLQLAVAPSCAD
jgi:hypothetical protein